MMGIGGSPTANQARLLGNRFDMLAIANPMRRWQSAGAQSGQCALDRGVIPPRRCFNGKKHLINLALESCL